MLFDGIGAANLPTVWFAGVLAAFLGTALLLYCLMNELPRDGGREFAHQGNLSAGKPRGAGLIFILVFAVIGMLFVGKNIEIAIYLLLTVAEMLTGYLDDRSSIPWNEYKKGLLDLIVAVIAAVTYIRCNGTTITISLLDLQWTVPPLLFGLAAVILIWVSINVTNCTDGVDGLLGTLSLITLGTLLLAGQITGMDTAFRFVITVLMSCLVGYLWFNATPSLLMMGDAGSRALGFFIAVAALKTGDPFLYLLAALVMIVDGGAGLAKIALLRFLKIHILKNIRTPIHDHVRKNKDWSNTHTVFRFAAVQLVFSAATIWILLR